MNKIEIEKKRLIEIVIEQFDVKGEFSFTEASPWVSDGKYDRRDVIVQHLPSGKFYRYQESRTGSPYTEYTYGWEYASNMLELVEVEEKQKTVSYWEIVQ